MAEQQNNPFNEVDLGTSRLIHLADQAGAHLPLMAGLLGTFYKSLVEEGLPDDFAQAVVLEWFAKVIGIDHEED